MFKPTLSFSEAINASTSKIFDCKGRSRRSEFWWSYLAAFVLSVILPFLSPLLMLATIPLTIRRLHDTGRSGWWWGVGALLDAGIFILFCSWWGVIFYNYASQYDYDIVTNNFVTNEVKFYIFFFIYSAITYIYHIVLIVFCCQDSEFFENKYGPSPKYCDEGLGDL